MRKRDSGGRAVKLTITVPWDALCSDNRKFLSGKFILSQEYRAARELLAVHAKVAMKKQKWVVPQGKLKLTVTVVEPDHRRRDLNWSKATKDSLTHAGVWVDDSQVRWELWHSVDVDKAKAGATITVEEL